VTTQIDDRIEELTRRRVPFVQATVVRAQEPSSARAGDRAIVLPDGSVEGFVGGSCAVGSVRTAALEALQTGAGVLLRVLPGSGEPFPETPGASVVVNPCLSGGALEIFLEPLLPSPVLHLVGTSPIARSLAELAPALGFVVDLAADGASPEGAVAAVVCTHGGDEAAPVREALDAGVGLVGVVCSRTRGRALLEELDLAEEDRSRVVPHIGVDIGARTAPEVALSILGALVRAVRVDGLVARQPRDQSEAPPLQVVDPVCGMTVTVGPDTPHAVVGGLDRWFCGPGCRDRYVRDHAS
jgi:xanthine dehydrogenase accessory factor